MSPIYKYKTLVRGGHKKVDVFIILIMRCKKMLGIDMKKQRGFLQLQIFREHRQRPFSRKLINNDNLSK